MIKRGVFVACCALLIAHTESSGQTMVVEFEGVITNGSDTADTLGLGFDLAGRSIAGSFSYQPDHAPPDSDAAVNVVNHQSDRPNSGWFALPELQIDDVVVPVPDFSLVVPPDAFADEDFASIVLRDFEPPLRENVEFLRFRAVNDGGSGFADYTLQLGLFDALDIISAADLETSFAVNDFSGILQSNSVFSLSTAEGFELLVNSFELTSLTVSKRRLPGDFNNDGSVDAADVDVWTETYGSTTDERADGDGDGLVGGSDFLIWQRNLGVTPSVSISVIAVPEPSGLSLTVAIGCLFFRRSGHCLCQAPDSMPRFVGPNSGLDCRGG